MIVTCSETVAFCACIICFSFIPFCIILLNQSNNLVIVHIHACSYINIWSGVKSKFTHIRRAILHSFYCIKRAEAAFLPQSKLGAGQSIISVQGYNSWNQSSSLQLCSKYASDMFDKKSGVFFFFTEERRCIQIGIKLQKWNSPENLIAEWKKSSKSETHNSVSREHCYWSDRNHVERFLWKMSKRIKFLNLKLQLSLP